MDLLVEPFNTSVSNGMLVVSPADGMFVVVGEVDGLVRLRPTALGVFHGLATNFFTVRELRIVGEVGP